MANPVSDHNRVVSDLEMALRVASRELVAERNEQGYWEGELASSALSTATAISALSLLRQESTDRIAQLDVLIEAGLEWLIGHQNEDGGWGDTDLSHSNIATTMLVDAAVRLAGASDAHESQLSHAQEYIEKAGRIEGVRARYGKDRTFAVPILMNCALAGEVGWEEVAPLPFELACLPHAWFRMLRLHVVSYALPALIAVGQIVHARRPSWNVVTKLIRKCAKNRSLRKLESIQPESGGFLEATPLTSFVTMSLLGLGLVDHPVTRQGIRFLFDSAREDGSWPIDTNLSVWVTTLSVNALACQGPLSELTTGLNEEELRETRDWILDQQYRTVHPYTMAAPGGWGWSHLPGSVPDADDTPGALLALAHLPQDESSCLAARGGINWLLGIQNRDGGWPTFCRGWTDLPFDRSGSDLTAHVIRALLGSSEGLHVDLLHGTSGQVRVDTHGGALRRAIDRGIQFLKRVQRCDGSWVPLWFGNQDHPLEENPIYGTSKVLAAFRDLRLSDSSVAQAGQRWLMDHQNPNGSWGGSAGNGSMEETGLAMEGLVHQNPDDSTIQAIATGGHWLSEQVLSGNWTNPSPIGFYFAKLWYYEKLYPMVFTVAGLGRALRTFQALGQTDYGSE